MTHTGIRIYLKCLLIHSYLALQARQIEIIFYEILRDLGKIFMPEQGAERGDPGLRSSRRGRHSLDVITVAQRKENDWIADTNAMAGETLVPIDFLVILLIGV
jgi:hypothetical protein